jgi:Uncharacterized membrane protein, putative virulence factor
MKNDKEFQQTLENSIELMLFFIIPATFGLIFLNKEIIALIYQHGNFTYQDTLITSKNPFVLFTWITVLRFTYYLYQKISFTIKYKISFNSRSDYAFNKCLLGHYTSQKIGVPGIALATSISGFFGMLLTGFSTFKSLKLENWIEIIKIFGASLIMAFFIIIFKTFFIQDYGQYL